MQIFNLKKSDSSYPPLLRQIHKPPELLYYRGNLPDFDCPIIAIVGTRYPSNYGVEMAKFFTEYLAQAGFLIVSGFASGIDFIAHKTAVENSARTIAVLGCGIDIIYPSENRFFEKKLLENGAFLSEFPLGTKPTKYNFPQRNRIISGMSHATLVIEAPEKSGALITADFALEQGRDVFAVPGNLNQKNSIGTNNLIHRGEAMLVTHPAEILEALKMQPVLFPHFDKKRRSQKISGAEKKIADLLEKGPLHIDEIIIASGLSPAECGSLLMNLQLKNMVLEERKIFRLKM